MTIENRLQTLLNKLVVPPQDLATLSFCNSTKEGAVKSWLQSLPLTQVQYISGVFYSALPEIGRLKTTAENRLAILELLRIPVDQCLHGMSQRYLNQPLILPDAALKTATIAQAIQKHLLNAYLVVVRDLCNEPKKELEAQQAMAIHRAMTTLGLLLLRSYQLYIPVPGQIWIEIHALYQLAGTLDLTHHAMEDQLHHHSNSRHIHWVYLRILLLASARPNQLRQDEVAATYNALDYLAQFAELDDYSPIGQENLFVINTEGNRPPFYKSQANTSKTVTDISRLFELRTNRLVAKLQEHQPLGTDSPEHGNTWLNQLNMSAALTQHLVQAWSHLAMRSFDRQDTNADIELTIGLTNIHFHLAEGQSFNIFLHQTTLPNEADKGAIFQKRGVQLKENHSKKDDDPWDGTFDIAGTIFDGQQRSTSNIEKELREQEKQNYQGQHPIYSVPMVDRSPGGYGLEWRDEIPAQMRAGELVGLREYGRVKWSIGVVRWAHQIKGATQLGIQVIAPQAIPAGIAIIHKTGGFSEYLRALQIPELKAINQPASLITNAVSFHEYNKVRLYNQPQKGVSPEGNRTIQLIRRLFATGAFSQFSFRDIMINKPPIATPKDDFNSVWE